MSQYSYISLLNAIQAFSESHLQIKRFASDFPSETPNLATEGDAFPVLFINPTSSIYDVNTSTIFFDAYCYDIIQKDRSNINTILSDTSLILNDLKIWLTDGDIGGIDVIEVATASPINNGMLDYLAGWRASFQVEMDQYGICDIPFTSMPIITGICNNVFFTNALTCDTLASCPVIIDILDQISGFTTFDVYVTGGTYSNGTASFINNSGQTFNVSGFFTGETDDDIYVTGGTLNVTANTLTFTNNSGGTFNVSNIITQDIFVTAGGQPVHGTSASLYRAGDIIISGSSRSYQTNDGISTNGASVGHIQGAGGTTGFIQMFGPATNGGLPNVIIGGGFHGSLTNPAMSFVGVRNNSYQKFTGNTQTIFRFSNGYATILGREDLVDINANTVQLYKYSGGTGKYLTTDANGTLVLVPNSGVTSALTTSNIINVSNVTGATATDALNQTTVWRGQWVQDTYLKNQQVIDNSFLAIANKTTEERPMPQPIGSPEYIYSGTIGSNSVSAKQVLFGNRYTFNENILLEGWRINVVAGNRYIVYLVKNPTTVPVISQVINFTAQRSGWQALNISTTIILNGSTYDLVAAVSEPDPTPTTFSGAWNYQKPTNITAPVAGQITHATKDLTSLNVSKTDNAAVNRTAQLSGLTLGDIISVETTRWAIQSSTDNGTYYTFGISPATQLTSTGVKTFVFETTTATPITVPFDANYWASFPPTNIVAQGLLGVDIAYATVTGNTTAYGVDLLVREVLPSPDWDLQAFTSVLSSGSGGDTLWAVGSGGTYSLITVNDTTTSATGDYAIAEGADNIASGDYSKAEGFRTDAIGDYSHSEGVDTTAQGNSSHAEGDNTQSIGLVSHAEGSQTISVGNYSHAQGFQTQANGEASHSEGSLTQANNFASHAEGDGSIASGVISHAEGANTQATGTYSHSEGNSTQASGNSSHAEGGFSIAGGNASHAEGNTTVASGDFSHSEGLSTVASGQGSHAEGDQSIASGTFGAHAEGELTQAIGNASHSEGSGTIALMDYAHSEGYQTQANGIGSHAEGYQVTATGDYSHSEGVNTQSIGTMSHAEGQLGQAVGVGSHVEGNTTIASNNWAHAEGDTTQATGQASHSQGTGTIASALNSHAEGLNTRAIGNQSHAEGSGSQATGTTSHAEGTSTIAGGLNSHAEGNQTRALGIGSHAEGSSSIANSFTSHAEGAQTVASGNSAHAEGAQSIAGGNQSHAEGQSTQAIGNQSHAEGEQSQATGQWSHAEGFNTRATGTASHAAGNTNTASGDQSFASGLNSFATGTTSFVHGNASQARGLNTVVFGASITGTAANTTYVDSFNIKTVTASTSTNIAVRNADGSISTRVLSGMPFTNTATTININGVSQDLSTNRTWRTALADTGALTFTNGGVSINNATGKTINVGACTGYVINNETNPLIPVTTLVTYTGQTGLTVTTVSGGVATYILLNSSGTIVFQNTFPTSTQRKSMIYLAGVSHANLTSLGFVKNEVDFITSPLAQFRDVFQSLNYVNEGVFPLPNGANLNMNTTAGSVIGDGINFVTDKTNPNTVAVTATTVTNFVYRNQTGGTSGFQTAIDPTTYDLNGVTTAIGGPANNSTIQYVYLGPTVGITIQRGQTIYSTLAAAIAAIRTETFVVFPTLIRNAICIGVIAMRRSATDLSNPADAQFFRADKFGQIGGAAGGVSVSTMQNTYNNSGPVTPKILTSLANDGISIQSGSLNTDLMLRVLNTGATDTFMVNASGAVTSSTMNVSAMPVLPVATFSGTSIRIDASGNIVRSPFNEGQTIFKDGNSASTVTGTVNETANRAILISGGTFAVGDILRVSALGSKTGVAGTATLRLKANSAATLTGSVTLSTSTTAAGNGFFTAHRHLNFRSGNQIETVDPTFSLSSDLGTGAATIALITTFDPALDWYLMTSIQNGSAADSSNTQQIIIEKL